MDKFKSTFDTVRPLISTLWTYFENGVLTIECSHWMHSRAIAIINISFTTTQKKTTSGKVNALILWAQALCKACCRSSFLFYSQVTVDAVLICEIAAAFFVYRLTLWHNNCMATLFLGGRGRRGRERETHTHTHKERQTDRQTDRQRQRDTERDRERQRETETERQRETETQTVRQK